jgi:hypothetical protein
MALSYAADGEFTLATGIAEKVERLAPWSPRYLQLQVYLDEEGARRRADSLVTMAREHLAAERNWEARAAAQDALAAMPGTSRLKLSAARAAPEPRRSWLAPGRRRYPRPHLKAPRIRQRSRGSRAAPGAGPAPPLDPRIAEAVAECRRPQHFLKTITPRPEDGQP